MEAGAGEVEVEGGEGEEMKSYPSHWKGTGEIKRASENHLRNHLYKRVRPLVTSRAQKEASCTYYRRGGNGRTYGRERAPKVAPGWEIRQQK